MRRVSKNISRCLAATPNFNNFKASDMIYNVDKNPKPLPDNFHSQEYLQDLAFGSLPTPHMLHIDWNAKTGWGKPRIEPFGPMVIPAASGSLHYGMQVSARSESYRQGPTGSAEWCQMPRSSSDTHFKFFAFSYKS